jgi:tetratricopeptide (TPR) repeat protein
MSDQNLADLIQQGRRCLDRGDFRNAITYFEQAAAQAHAWGEGENELIALGWLPAAWGSVAEHQREVEAATRLLSRARELRREDYELVATLRLAEAIADLDLRGHWRELKPLLLQGIETARRLNKPWYEFYHRMLLGVYAVKMGEDDEGYAWLQQTLNALHPDIERNTVPRCLFRLNIYGALARLMSRRGDHAEALRYAEMSLGLAQEERNPAFIAEAALKLARARLSSGDLAGCRQLIEDVLPQARQQGWKAMEQQAEYLLAELELVDSQPDAAEVPARRALELAQELKLREEEVLSMLALGKVLQALRQKHEAQSVLSHARRLAQERDYADHFGEIEKLL